MKRQGRVASALLFVFLPARAVPPQDPAPTIYDPTWAAIAPLELLSFDYDPGKTTLQNGEALRLAILSLHAGQRLEIGSGVYTLTSSFHAELHGAPNAPIWIVAKTGASPVITRLDASQNLLDLGAYPSPTTEYVCVRGIEFVGGSAGIRIHGCANVWIDRCRIHHTDDVGLSANTVDVRAVFLTRNEIHHTGGTGEGMYLGSNYAETVMSRSTIALNHVYSTGGSQGDGIELKQGSWGNWVVANYVHDTNYPCILVYGTGGAPVNVIEGNVCHGSSNAVMQVQGEALVWNNLLVAGSVGFESHDHQGSTQYLVAVHNTIVNVGPAAALASWAGRPGMVFGNNAAYSLASSAVSFGGGSAGVMLAGNVAYGPVYGASSGFAPGWGLGDFLAVAWGGGALLAVPVPWGPLNGAASPALAAPLDLIGTPRVPPIDAGCLETWW